MELNLPCPYPVELDDETSKYKFITDTGGQFEVILSDFNAAFTDTFFEQNDCYEISVFPVNDLPKGNSAHFVSTLKQIVLHFFADTSRILFYQCLIDGKESHRSRKFSWWYALAEVDDLLKKIDTVITKGKDEYHQTMIYHTENTNATILADEFKKIIYDYGEK